MARGGTPSMRGRADAGGLQHGERLLDLRREQHAPAPVGELLGERQAGQRIERVVEIEQQLAPQHARHVGMLGDGAPGTSSASRKPATPARDQDRAAGGAMKAGRVPFAAGLHDVEGHHARRRALRGRKARAQGIEIADAVLQADDDGVGGAWRAIRSAISAVAPLLTVTRTISAPAKRRGRVGGERQRRRRQGCGRRRRDRRCAGRSCAMASARAGRSSSVTLRPASARQPPT